MPVVVAWLRLDVRRRWRSLGVLVLLVAVAAGTVMTALAGARRGASVLDRLEARTLPANAAITANTPNFDWGPIDRLPYVDAFTMFGPSYSIDGLPAEIEAQPAYNTATFRTIEKPVMFSGRMFDIHRADEAVVPPDFASKFHKRVGDTFQIVLPTPRQFQTSVANQSGGRYSGPRVTVHIVGVGLEKWFSDGPVISPALVAKYPGNLVGTSGKVDQPGYANALLRLHGGSADIPRLRADLARVSGRSDIEVLDLDVWVDRPLLQQTSFEARCLLAFGLAAFFAALFLVGQAITRYAAATTAELQTLRALGMSPRQALAAAAGGPAIVGAAGGVLGVVGAFAASHWFPIGTAKDGEPSPGLSADWVVFGPGLALVVALVAGGALAAAWLALGAGNRAGAGRRSSVAAMVSRSGLPVPVVVGSRFALETGRGRTSVPVRPALIGAVAGVLGVLAAFTFSHAVSDAADHPERFGQTFQLTAFAGDSGHDLGPVGALMTALRENDDVAGVDDGRTAVATGPAGKGSVTLYSYSTGPKPLDVVVSAGRMPRTAGEVLLAPQTLQTLHAHVGQRVPLIGSTGKTRMLVVTGTGFVPNGFHNIYADGGWVTEAGYDSLFDSYKFRVAYVALRPGTDSSAVGAKLTHTLAAADPHLANFFFEPPAPLSQVKALRQVRVLPLLLGLFLAVLAVGAVGHALATAVRRRSHDLAVLRALGLTRTQCRWIVVTQASVLAVIGLIFGVPLGIAVGRTVWRAVADYTPFQYVAPSAVWALWLAAPAALVTANLLAAWPGRRAARLRIAQILRAE